MKKISTIWCAVVTKDLNMDVTGSFAPTSLT
jgi:hypothetical protein